MTPLKKVVVFAAIVLTAAGTTLASASQGPGVALGTASPRLQTAMMALVFGPIAGIALMAIAKVISKSVRASDTAGQ